IFSYPHERSSDHPIFRWQSGHRFRRAECLLWAKTSHSSVAERKEGNPLIALPLSGMAKTKSGTKKPAAKTRSQAQSSARASTKQKSAEAKSPETKSSKTTPSVSKKSGTKSFGVKAADKGTVRFGPTTKCGKPPDKTSPRKESKKSGDKSANGTDADVAESAKIDPPPPEVAEPDKAMSPEEAERARKRYLLKRFWVTARGFWGKSGVRIAWVASIGLLLLIILLVAVQYGINIWNRNIFDAIEKRDSTTVLWLS